jgi:glycosidase
MSGGRGCRATEAAHTDELDGGQAQRGFTSGTPYRRLSANVETNNVAAQSADPSSLLAFYKAMLKLRNTLPSIATRQAFDRSFVEARCWGCNDNSARGIQTRVINYGDTTPACR